MQHADLSNSESFRCIKNSCPSSTSYIQMRAPAREACKARRAGFIVIVQLSTYSQEESEGEVPCAFVAVLLENKGI